MRLASLYDYWKPIRNLQHSSRLMFNLILRLLKNILITIYYLVLCLKVRRSKFLLNNLYSQSDFLG